MSHRILPSASSRPSQPAMESIRDFESDPKIVVLVGEPLPDADQLDADDRLCASASLMARRISWGGGFPPVASIQAAWTPFLRFLRFAPVLALGLIERPHLDGQPKADGMGGTIRRHIQPSLAESVVDVASVFGFLGFLRAGCSTIGTARHCRRVDLLLRQAECSAVPLEPDREVFVGRVPGALHCGSLDLEREPGEVHSLLFAGFFILITLQSSQ
jgi:hypothetical protein